MLKVTDLTAKSTKLATDTHMLQAQVRRVKGGELAAAKPSGDEQH